MSQTTEPVVPFKRKLSKREKKELKKQEKLAKLKVWGRSLIHSNS